MTTNDKNKKRVLMLVYSHAKDDPRVRREARLVSDHRRQPAGLERRPARQPSHDVPAVAGARTQLGCGVSPAAAERPDITKV